MAQGKLLLVLLPWANVSWFYRHDDDKLLFVCCARLKSADLSAQNKFVIPFSLALLQAVVPEFSPASHSSHAQDRSCCTFQSLLL